MRGWKPIAFKTFKDVCEEYQWSSTNNFDVCYSVFENSKGLECCASFCSKWRKLGRADIKVSKITEHNRG